MKTRAIALTIALCFVATAVCLAADENIGTWKLNEAKSKFAPGATKNTTVVYEAMGDEVKVTVDGMDSSGKATHNEWTGKYDGKFYPVTGDPNTDERAYKQINDRKLELTTKKVARLLPPVKFVVSRDGKSRTVTTHSEDSMGKKVKNTGVYDKSTAGM